MDMRFVAGYALDALLFELGVTPKPGLVDKNNTGAHKDLTYALMEKSASAIAPFVGECAKSGLETHALSPAEAFNRLKSIGLRAEEAMYKATNGVNTHKGAVFCLCLISGAYGRILGSKEISIGNICREAALLAEGMPAPACAPETHGEIAYAECGLAGARGEAAAGYPSVRNTAIPALKSMLETRSLNDAGVYALLHLIARVGDTCLFARGGLEGMAFAKRACENALSGNFMENALSLDKAFIHRNLSPGGSADLLSAAVFLLMLTGEINREKVRLAIDN